MQLFAQDVRGRLHTAGSAQKGKDYFCVECRGIVRLRLGSFRRPHFFHLHLTPSCRQSGKSLIHLQTQCHIQSLLPLHEAVLERRFPSINRIADVVWEARKLIFEIQCSPISFEEVQERNRDYASQGYQVVWILHDQRFNKRHRTSAESFLSGHPHYFTNLDVEGKGMIYDQFNSFQRSFKKASLAPLPIDLAQPFEVRSIREGNCPTLLTIEKRLNTWPIHFSGDLLDKYRQGAVSYLQEALFFVDKPYSLQKKMKNFLSQWLIRPYRLFLQVLLERACR